VHHAHNPAASPPQQGDNGGQCPTLRLRHVGDDTGPLPVSSGPEINHDGVRNERRDVRRNRTGSQRPAAPVVMRPATGTPRFHRTQASTSPTHRCPPDQHARPHRPDQHDRSGQHARPRSARPPARGSWRRPASVPIVASSGVRPDRGVVRRPSRSRRRPAARPPIGASSGRPPPIAASSGGQPPIAASSGGQPVGQFPVRNQATTRLELQRQMPRPGEADPLDPAAARLGDQRGVPPELGIPPELGDQRGSHPNSAPMLRTAPACSAARDAGHRPQAAMT
jgi:hypothetical protein